MDLQFYRAIDNANHTGTRASIGTLAALTILPRSG
jgi:hypothetical protein